MINYQFSQEDIKFVEKAIELKSKGFYIDGNQLTEVYNRVLGKRVNPTNCGSCLRQRINELEGALNHFKAQKSVPEVEVDNTKEEVKEAVTDAGNNLKSKRKK